MILEAPASSYTYGNRVSVLTGHPTVMGWFTHEWLWKDVNEQGYTRANERYQIARKMLTSTDVNEIKNLLTEYKVEYV